MKAEQITDEVIAHIVRRSINWSEPVLTVMARHGQQRPQIVCKLRRRLPQLISLENLPVGYIGDERPDQEGELTRRTGRNTVSRLD